MSVQPSQACHGFSFKKGSIKILISDILVEHCTQQDLLELNLEKNNHSIEHVFLLVRQNATIGEALYFKHSLW